MPCRLVVAVGFDDPPPDWTEIDRRTAQAPVAPWPPTGPTGLWFHAELLVPDAWLVGFADAATIARWALVTGRSGRRDDYWFPESWERFLEQGHGAGCVTPSDVWRARPGRLSGAAEPTVAGAHDWDPPTPPTAAAFSPAIDRGICVPPGYALARCVGTLGVTVLAV